MLYRILLFSVKPQHESAISSVQFSSVTQSCPTLCNPMNCSTPGLPVHHELPEFTQTHVHRVGDAIQPSHPLSSPSPPTPNPSQHWAPTDLESSSFSVLSFCLFILFMGAGVQPRWIQGIRSRDGVGEDQETTA